MKARHLCTAVFAATTLLFTAGAHADVYGDDCRRNPPRISADCNDDLNPDKNPPPLISREKAQAMVDAVKAKRAAATAAAIAANRCGTGQILVGGSCQDVGSLSLSDSCGANTVWSNGSCVPLPQVSPQCEPASRFVDITWVESTTWGTKTANPYGGESGYTSANCIGGIYYQPTRNGSARCEGGSWGPTYSYPAYVSAFHNLGSCNGTAIASAEYAGYKLGMNVYFTNSIAFHCPSGMVAKHVFTGLANTYQNILTYCVTQ